MKSRIAPFVAFLAASAFGIGFASADTYKLDSVHSSVVFKINHLGVSNTLGRFDSPEGTFVTDEGKESFEATVPVANIDTGNPKRDQHLKSPDFFNAAQFTDITFKSTAVKKTGDNYEVTGDLTLHGVTKSIVVTLNKVGEADTPMKDHRFGLETSFTIKRSDYGMSFMTGAVGDEVTLWINLEGVKQ